MKTIYVNGDSFPAGAELAEYQRKHNIQPGTDAWFKLWYARPGLTGEKNV